MKKSNKNTEQKMVKEDKKTKPKPDKKAVKQDSAGRKAQKTFPVKSAKTPVEAVTEKHGGKSANKNKKTLKVRFLGGVGEIGKNMTVLEFGNDIMIIDAGLTFPGDNMPGVDFVIPDSTYLEQNKNRIKGIVITHGHEDHIGALPYLLRDIKAPVYGTKLTLTLIENKIREQNLNNVILNCVKAGSVVKIGCFSVEFINVNHSIAGAVALAVTTPVGVVFHTGDFKVDYTPVSGETTDLTRIAEIGKRGVLLTMADSTNIEIEGSTMSEARVKETLARVFAENSKRRLIIATFASNVHRLQQILDLAERFKRKVALSGRSMINIAEAAAKIGELTIPDNILVDVEKIKNFRDSEILIISTGTQGEPMSALTRMAHGEFNKIVIGENDTVVISASVIPGNEKMIYGVINDLYKLGAEVIYESLEPIHVSGHACRQELRMIHSLLKSKFFIPVHGEYRHLKKHAALAQSVGIKKSNILVAEIGDTVELTKDEMFFGEKFPAGSRFVDGVGIDGEDSLVIRDRLRLSEDGIITVVAAIDGRSLRAVSVEIAGKGVTLGQDTLDAAKELVIGGLKKVDLRTVKDEAELEGIIIRSVRNYLYKATGKNPVIMPVIVEV